ncbi:MAG: hypothetical protein HC773_15500, partial [Scytonema sp. CRU_2_7]|nr:hypothetical protein [Scytonema sp. CRU_2_7]
TPTPYGYRGRLPVSLRREPVAYGGASAVLGSPQVEHLALETLLQRWSHQMLPLREAATRLQAGKPGRQIPTYGGASAVLGSQYWLPYDLWSIHMKTAVMRTQLSIKHQNFSPSPIISSYHLAE